MQVNGNTFTNPGDMVLITIPYHGISDKKNTTNMDKFLNGRFMVRQIEHTFTTSSFNHSMKMSCVRDSFEDALDFVEDGTPEGDQTPKDREVYEDFYL